MTEISFVVAWLPRYWTFGLLTDEGESPAGDMMVKFYAFRLWMFGIDISIYTPTDV